MQQNTLRTHEKMWWVLLLGTHPLTVPSFLTQPRLTKSPSQTLVPGGGGAAGLRGLTLSPAHPDSDWCGMNM